MIYRLKNQAGYSLVEVVVAIVLLGLAIIPMVGMFDAGLRAAVLGGSYDRGRALAGEELAEIRALPFDRPGTTAPDSVAEIYPPAAASSPCTETPADPIDTMFDCRVETAYVRLADSGIVADPEARTLMRVEVTVTWDDNSYTTIGLVAKDSG
ncbi:MAG: prepilin-type N-terminal cleavage/methylation domain-containing protein [Rubrobacteraceae bacterium]